MASAWKKLLLIPLAATFMLAGCSEPPQEAARKPDVVAQMVENSVSICEKGPVNATGAEYAARLTKVLNDVRTTKLETLQAKGITVCLDQRLDHQTTGFWDTPAMGVFYNNGTGGGTLTVYDNGTQPADASFWKRDTYDWGATAVDSFARHMQKGEVTPQSGNWYAYTYTVSTGKSSYTALDWTKAAKFDQETIAKNPELQKPPITAPAPKAPITTPAKAPGA
ncbi:MAG: hypothetical protein ACAH80_11505 [Alphaproteobacteria bacterium]